MEPVELMGKAAAVAVTAAFPISSTGSITAEIGS